MAKIWHVVIDGKQQGPLSNTELKALAQTGKLQPRDKAWKEGLPEWVPASKIKGLFLSKPPITTEKDEKNPPESLADKKAIKDYDPLGDTFNAIATVQDSAQTKAVNIFYRVMDWLGALPLLGRLVRNRWGWVISGGISVVLFFLSPFCLVLIDKLPIDKDIKQKLMPMIFGIFIGLFSFFFCFLQIIGAWIGCPGCQRTWAREFQSQEHLGSSSGVSLVSRRDYHSDRQGNIFGHTDRLEQVAVVRSKYRFFWKCRHCGHEWATVQTQEREQW